MVPHFLKVCIILMCCFCLIGAASGHLAEKTGIGEILLLLLATLMTLAMTGLYAGSETALVSVDKSFINKSLADGDERAKIVKTLTRSHNRMLGMTLVGTNIMHVATSELGLILVVSILSYSEVTAKLLQHWHIKPVLVATVITTSLILVFAEILPKTIFRAQANNLALRYAYYLRISDIIFRPIVSVVTHLPRLLTQYVGQSQKNVNVRRDELRLVATIGEQSGTIGRGQRRMIHSALDFQRQRVEEIMVPLVEMVAVEKGTSTDDLLKISSESGYSRIPVYDERFFNIIGVVNILDAIYAKSQSLANVHSGDRSTDSRRVVDELMNTNLQFVPESKPIHALLQDLKSGPHTMAFVVDEYGGIVGLVTVEDLVEEIVGELTDERDSDHQIRQISPNTIECDGRTEVDRLNEVFGLEIPTGDYETIAGYLLDLEKTLPTIGAQVETAFLFLTVANADVRTIRQIRIRKKSGQIQKQ